MPRARVALLVALAAALAAGTAARAQDAAQLEELRSRIERSREKVEAHEAKERAIFDRIDELERSLASLGTSVRAAREDARRARAALDEIERETERLAGRLRVTRDAMRRRAVALYKAGEVGPLRVLFAAESLRELLQRTAALERMLESDASLVARYEGDAAAYRAARKDAERATARHERSAIELRDRLAVLESERDAKSELLARVRSDRRQEREVMVELEKAARALEATLAELGSSGRVHGAVIDGSAFGAVRGQLPLPVEAPIVAGFGRVTDAEFLTQTVRNGVEFGAEEGERVSATARGEVRFAGWFRGYGRIVILDHGDSYFSISGHLSEIDVAVGDLVQVGQAIGRAGDTGSLSGPKLYFELRQGKQAIDPAPWFSPDRLATAR